MLLNTLNFLSVTLTLHPYLHMYIFPQSCWWPSVMWPLVWFVDQHILRDLERRKILVFTPSRRVAGKRVVCNDDWFIVKLAYESDGVIVSNDMYRDLHGKEPQWKRFIEERLLMYSFVNDKSVVRAFVPECNRIPPLNVPCARTRVWMWPWRRFMPPDDPLGRHGPTLENFLRKFPKTQKKPPCPYGKRTGGRHGFWHCPSAIGSFVDSTVNVMLEGLLRWLWPS